MGGSPKAVLRGPLLYALPLNFTAAVIDTYFPPHGVDESLSPREGQPWRHALVLSQHTASQLARQPRPEEGPGSRAADEVGSVVRVAADDTRLRFRRLAVPRGSTPFTAAGVRGVVDAWVRQVRVSAWPTANCTTNFAAYRDSCAGATPTSPLQAGQVQGAARRITLRPYGSIDVGFGELPYVAP